MLLSAVLHPLLPPRRTFPFVVSDGHVLMVDEAGPPEGIAVIMCHGGPGGPVNPHERRFFDPARFRLIAMDQRGAFRSKPLGGLVHNTSDHLAADMEALRLHLGIARWWVWGGSFGSALALHYAQTFPQACHGLILHSILIGSPGFETRDFDDETLAPESRATLARAMPGNSDAPLSTRCYEAILGENEQLATLAAALWYQRSAALSAISPDALPCPAPDLTWEQQRAAARLSAHYWQNRLFLPQSALTCRAGRLAGLPGYLVHGLADQNTPVSDARALQRSWPGSQLIEVSAAGHSPFEPGAALALRRAVDLIAEEQSPNAESWYVAACQ